MRHTDDPSGSASPVDVDSIVPERALQQTADHYGYSVDALRAAVRENLERNRQMADRICDRRPIVYRADDYLVVRASDGVAEETRLPVLGVYEQMDGSDTDYAAGYPLVVPTSDDETDDYAGFENAAEKAGDVRD